MTRTALERSTVLWTDGAVEMQNVELDYSVVMLGNDPTRTTHRGSHEFEFEQLDRSRTSCLHPDGLGLVESCEGT
jgi:hypothetical protein